MITFARWLRSSVESDLRRQPPQMRIFSRPTLPSFLLPAAREVEPSGRQNRSAELMTLNAPRNGVEWTCQCMEHGGEGRMVCTCPCDLSAPAPAATLRGGDGGLVLSPQVSWQDGALGAQHGDGLHEALFLVPFPPPPLHFPAPSAKVSPPPPYTTCSQTGLLLGKPKARHSEKVLPDGRRWLVDNTRM